MAKKIKKGTFEENRQNLIDRLKAKAKGRPLEKKIKFNEDVPSFLKKLKEFEEISRQKVIIVK